MILYGLFIDNNFSTVQYSCMLDQGSPKKRPMDGMTDLARWFDPSCRCCTQHECSQQAVVLLNHCLHGLFFPEDFCQGTRGLQHNPVS